MYKKALLTRFQMVYLNASWIDTVEKLWPFENFEHKNYENGYTIREVADDELALRQVSTWGLEAQQDLLRTRRQMKIHREGGHYRG